MDYSKLERYKLIKEYVSIIKELKRRDIIRTNNVIGEFGEYLSVEYYKKIKGLPKLYLSKVGSESYDAESENGDRYSIKSITTNNTGVFYGLEPKDSTKKDKKKFEYVIICKFNKDYDLEAIYELDWKHFLKHKKWHSRMKAWHLVLTKDMIKDCKTIYKKVK